MKRIKKHLNWATFVIAVLCVVALVSLTLLVVGGPEKGIDYTDERREFGVYSDKLLHDAEQGNVEAQYTLGNCYYYGFGIAQDYKKAVEWFRKAAEQHYAPAENDLGHCYYNGHGVERNEKEAERWWKRAVDDGNNREE